MTGKISVLLSAHLSLSLVVRAVQSHRALRMGLRDLVVLVYLVRPEKNGKIKLIIASQGCSRYTSRCFSWLHHLKVSYVLNQCHVRYH